MWIHVPGMSSVSVADTEELNLDSEWLKELGQSVTWKTKSVSLRSLQRVWKTVPSIRLLSGLTLEPSTLNRGVAKWISSLEDSHVSHSVSQEQREEPMTTETSGLKSSESQEDSATQLSFLKTSQESSTTTTKQSDQAFKKWATPLRKDSLQREKRAHLTRENGSLSWPTPTASERSGINPNTGKGEGLNKMAGNWPTPRVSDTEGGIAPNVEMNNGSFSRKNQNGIRWGVKEATRCVSVCHIRA